MSRLGRCSWQDWGELTRQNNITICIIDGLPKSVLSVLIGKVSNS